MVSICRERRVFSSSFALRDSFKILSWVPWLTKSVCYSRVLVMAELSSDFKSSIKLFYSSNLFLNWSLSCLVLFSCVDVTSSRRLYWETSSSFRSLSFIAFFSNLLSRKWTLEWVSSKEAFSVMDRGSGAFSSSFIYLAMSFTVFLRLLTMASLSSFCFLRLSKSRSYLV